MYRKGWLFLSCTLLSIAALPSCGSNDSEPTAEAGMPNPAAIYCQEQGHLYEIRSAADGSQTGVCILADGSECDEWAYFREECRPGDNPPQPEPTAPAGFETTAGGWKLFYNEALAYSFAYPPEASIEDDDDPLHSLTVLGPFVDDDHWPFIFISHPSGREDYSPPEGVDLAQWLVEHTFLPAEGQQLAAEVRQPDIAIAGTTAVHTRFERSPQSYAYDKYFFAHGKQLYTIVIVHTGDREDWELYNRFLNSFQFH